MRILLTTLSVFILTNCLHSYSQNTQTSHICPPYYNGSVAGSSCSKEYSLCVNGIHQAATCQDDHVFYQTSCVPISESPECATNDKTEDIDFDCSTKEDGSYSIGCRNEFVQCVSGLTYPMYCPSNLVYFEKAGRCLHTCDDFTENSSNTDTDGAYNVNEDSQSVEKDESDEHPDLLDCSNLSDGQYAQGCNSFFFVCSNGNTFISYCPSGLVYNANQRACDHVCTSSESYEADDSSISTSTPSPEVSETTTLYETPSTSAAYTSTNLPTTTPGSDEPTTVIDNDVFSTTIQSTVCQSGQISTFGQCASRFTKCSNGLSIITKQCPANTLFDSSILLCVYDLPQCQPTVKPVKYYVHSDIVQSPFDDSWEQYQGSHSNGKGYVHYIDNPFYSPPKGRHVEKLHPDYNFDYRHDKEIIHSPFSTFQQRAILDDSFRDHRTSNADRIFYGDSRKPSGGRVFAVGDSFDGKPDRFLASDVRNIFPKRSSKELGPEEDPDDFEDASGFGPNELFGASRRKRQVYGYPSRSESKNNRQSQVDESCKSFSVPTFLNFGDCMTDFIYCSGTGINRMAACPVGESFDKNTGICSEACGIVSSSPTPSSDVVTPTKITTTEAPIRPTTTEETTSDEVKCTDASNALISIGCSQEYIHCHDGVAIRRICPAALYFDESKSACDYRDNVPKCNGNETNEDDDNSVLTTSVPVETYSPTVKPYSPAAQVSQNMNDNTNLDPCIGLTDGSHGNGCSASYIICEDERLIKTMTCNLGEGYDPSSQLCMTFEKIPSWACDSLATTTDAGYVKPLPYVSLGSVLSTTTENPNNLDSNTVENYGSEKSVESQDVTDSPTIVFAETEKPQVVENICISKTRASLGFCVRSYLECDGNKNMYIQRNCSLNTLFDSKQNSCVDENICGHDSIRSIVQDEIGKSSYRATEPRCRNVAENTTISIGQCRTSYIRCSNGQSNMEHCAGNKVYSTEQSKCILRENHDGCIQNMRRTVKPFYNRPSSGGDAFCDGKADGLYRNPSDCSAIIQCFGGDIFEYPSCPAGLAFNEIKGKCDYAQSVEGCSTAIPEQEMECPQHGAFIANPDDCSIFYRCVWGQKVEMKCPSGTLFNTDLSVCDWPSAVSNCAANTPNESYSSGY